MTKEPHGAEADMRDSKIASFVDGETVAVVVGAGIGSVEGDRITLSVEGGKSLKLRAAVKAQVVTFFALVAEAQEKKKAKGFE